MLPEKSTVLARRRDDNVEMGRNGNKDGTAMKVPLPICFATLRKGVDGDNADDS